MTDIVAPLTPIDCELQGFPFTPVFRARLFGSSFHARATDAEWRSGVTLWLKSWDQVPAGSLPDDDIDLCRLAELGRDLKTWKKLRAGAMRGWVLCSDGRLYHPVVAEGVNEAWQGMQSDEAARRTGRERKRAQRGAENRAAILSKTDGHCTHCDCEITTHDHTLPTHLHVDHLHPLSRGGSHNFENLVPSCRRCNLKKGSNLNFKALRGGTA